jgi:hypothetical protein
MHIITAKLSESYNNDTECYNTIVEESQQANHLSSTLNFTMSREYNHKHQHKPMNSMFFWTHVLPTNYYHLII